MVVTKMVVPPQAVSMIPDGRESFAWVAIVLAGATGKRVPAGNVEVVEAVLEVVGAEEGLVAASLKI